MHNAPDDPSSKAPFGLGGGKERGHQLVEGFADRAPLVSVEQCGYQRHNGDDGNNRDQCGTVFLDNILLYLILLRNCWMRWKDILIDVSIQKQGRRLMV